ncbi:MAG: EAL domain-containing protein [Helicobacteraceae bacterium]|jgi:diguanylate cyclase (GGDEF)-like protein|nr:EAL domain-containing protein [Helicobacteraceae bacterium]
MRTYAVKYESQRQIEDLAEKNGLRLAPNLLATVFCATPNALFAIGQTLETLLPKASIAGLNVCLALCDDDFYDNETTIVFTDFENVKPIVFSFNEASEANAKKAILELKASNANNALVFCSQSQCEFKPFLRSLGKRLDTIVCVNSIAASLIRDGVQSHGGAIVVAFDGADFAFRIKKSVAPIAMGKELTITKIDKNRILELDRKRVEEVTKFYLGANPQSDAFAYLKAADNRIAAKINGSLFMNCEEGEALRLGILPKTAFDYGGYEELTRDRALWQFSTRSFKRVRASGCVAESVFLARESLLEQVDELLIWSDETEDEFKAMRETFANNFAREEDSMIRLLSGLSEDLVEQTRQNALKFSSQNLTASARRDSLTGLPGRDSFIEALSMAKSPSAAIFNIERFRDINDLYGYDAGNHIIKELAALLVASLGENVPLFRIGGDLFAVLADGYAEERFLCKINSAQSIVGATIFLEETLAASNIRLRAGVAYGIKQTLSRAEDALRSAKRKRTSIVIAPDGDNNTAQENLKMLNVVRQAAMQPWWTLANYQPIARVSDGQIVKYEALMRLRDANGRIYQPAAFLELAKRSRYYQELTKHIFTGALKLFKDRREAVAINLAPEDIQNNETMSYIGSLIAEFGEPERITLEVTESEMIEDYETTIEAISKMKKWGAAIAIDDFGSGYSNFAYLIKFQADYIKIDGSIVREVDKNEKAYQTMAAIVDFAKRLGLETIAEFISSESIAQKAKEAGVDYWQGYYIGQPAPL